MAFINVQGIVNYFNSLFSFMDSDKIPVMVNNSVQPIININPFGMASNISASLTTGGTFYTTPADSDFYLSQCYMAPYTNSDNTTRSCLINAVVNGTAVTLISGTITNNITPTVSPLYQINFNPAIKIDKNTPITLQITGAGLLLTSAGIFGFTFNSTPTGQQAINY